MNESYAILPIFGSVDMHIGQTSGLRVVLLLNNCSAHGTVEILLPLLNLHVLLLSKKLLRDCSHEEKISSTHNETTSGLDSIRHNGKPVQH